ncbi:hypothetical protein K2173_000597 [Erythroxylum novogranatense]|uniref:Secreted protein n=1 Tax=Erythroxylum novogranatense TaxID=1862640 RepID=A0AAV8S7X8_9ROSI|nr:hypothetical protein K2173_000597 [Erythroxylum novogranatense]
MLAFLQGAWLCTCVLFLVVMQYTQCQCGILLYLLSLLARQHVGECTPECRKKFVGVSSFSETVWVSVPLILVCNFPHFSMLHKCFSHF